MGIDSEAKPELYQQTPRSCRRQRRGQVPHPGAWLCPASSSGTQRLSQPTPACHTCPAQCTALPWHEGPARKGNISYCCFRLQPKGRPLGKNRRLDLVLVLASLGWAATRTTPLLILTGALSLPWVSLQQDEPQLHSAEVFRDVQPSLLPGKLCAPAGHALHSLLPKGKAGTVPTVPFRTSATI